MDIETLYQKYNKINIKEAVIIKRKKERLYFTITSSLYKKDKLSIYVDSEYIYIGYSKIKISDLKRIYIYALHGRMSTSYSLEFVGKSFINIKSINISNLLEDDLGKIYELLEHFIYSNEKDYTKLASNEYEFIIPENPIIYNNQLNKNIYDQKNKNEIIVDDKEYAFYQTLPKSYYSQYANNRYLLFETKYKNSNYMDVWVSKEELRERDIRINMKLAISVIILIITIVIVNNIDYLIYNILK